jgi:hypothetical protein
VAPYHVLRGLGGHLLLAEASAVPFGVFLAMSVALGRPLWRTRASGNRLLRWASPTSLRTIALIVWVSSCGIYYAAFTIMFVLVAAVAGRLARAEARGILTNAGGVLAGIGVVLVLNMLPTVLYHRAHGTNDLVGQRNPNESLTYGLNLIGQILPPSSHRFGPLASLGNEWWGQTNTPSEGPTWGGTLSVIGLLLLTVSALVAMVGTTGTRWLADARLRATALVALTAALVGATGAGGAFVAFILNPSLRGWNRIGIVLVFCGLLAVALALEALRGCRWAQRGRRGTVAMAIVVPVLLAFGAWDQTWTSMKPNYTGARAEWSNDAHFVQAISASLGGHGEVYQMPYLAFPESPPIVGMSDYSPLKGYVHAGKGIKWSYGAMKGRPADWQEEASQLPIKEQVSAVALAGFDGVWIDGLGYTDPQAEVLNPLRRLTGVAPIISADNRLTYFDLRPLRARLASRMPADEVDTVGPTLTHPLQLTWGDGFYTPEQDAKHSWRWARGSSSITIDNPMDHARDIVFAARLSTGRRSDVRLTLDDKPMDAVAATPYPGHTVSERFRVPPGKHRLGLTTSAPRTTPPAGGDQRDLRLQVLDAHVGDAALDDLAG